MPKPKTTSLDKILAALDEQGWQYEAVKGTVKVPDPDSPNIRRDYSGRARSLPLKEVPGTIVTATNPEGDSYGRVRTTITFTTKFTETGGYIAGETNGPWPFHAGTSLKVVLEKVETHGPKFQRALKEQREAEDAERDRKEQEEIRAAYADAVLIEEQTRAALVESLVQNGLTAEQADMVVGLVDNGAVSDYVVSRTRRDRVGQGWTPGRTSLMHTYVNGERVG